MVLVGLSWPIPCIMHRKVVVPNRRFPLIWSRGDKPIHRGGPSRWYKVHNSNHHISKLSNRYQSVVVLLSLAPPVYKGCERTSTIRFLIISVWTEHNRVDQIGTHFGHFTWFHIYLVSNWPLWLFKRFNTIVFLLLWFSIRRTLVKYIHNMIKLVIY